MTNVVRVVPYAATQFASYDFYKNLLISHEGPLTNIERLSAGALAGMTATTLTHPLDVIRLRLSVQVVRCICEGNCIVTYDRMMIVCAGVCHWFCGLS